MVAEMEPEALEAAKQSAQQDLACTSVTPKVVAREHGDMSRATDLYRIAYKIETTGCRKQIGYAVACVYKGICSAMSDGTGIRYE